MSKRNNQKKYDNSNEAEFIYRITHDLKAPLRGIQNLTQWIKEDINSGDTKSLNENIALVNDLVIRTNRMMDAIKSYSRLDEEEDPLNSFESHQLINDIVIKLTENHELDTEVNGDQFTFSAPKKKLRLCLEAIIENAIEFNTTSNPKLSVLIEDHELLIKVVVKDNGPGIPDYITNSMFGLFTTTKTKDDLKFLGVGLALAKKSINIVGGSLIINSNQEGTEAIINWPKSV